MAVNNFLAWAIGGAANVLSQVAYAALGEKNNGYADSVKFPAEAANKIFRQSSVISATVAQFIADAGFDALDDGDLPTLLANFKSALASSGARAVSKTFIQFTAGGGHAVAVVSGTFFGVLCSGGTTISINMSANGANGLDVGAIANNTWYSIWAILKDSDGTVAGLASIQATAPTLPAGYTSKIKLGWGKASANHLSFVPAFQQGNHAQLVTPANASNGVHGVIGVPTWSPVDLGIALGSSLVPVDAVGVSLIVANKYNNGAGAHVMVAPSDAYGGVTSTTLLPPVYIDSGDPSNQYVSWLFADATVAQIIYFISDAAGGAVNLLGWELSL